MRSISVILVAALSCKSHEAPPPPSPSDLVVVSPGVLPQRLLHYQLAKGTKSTLELEVEGTLTAGAIPPSTAPPLVFSLEIVVDDVTADGHMKLTTTIQELTTHAAADQPGAPAATTAAAALKGLEITSLLAPDGAITDVKIASDDRALSEAAKAQVEALVQAIPKLAMPLPSTPVGIGAKWRSSRALGPVSPLALQSVTTIDLTGVAGSSITYEVGSTVHGADQKVTQDGVEVDVNSITGTATGRGTFDLQKLAITGTLKAELHMDMTTGSDRTPMTMTLELRSH
ncbi:MAG: hypothetical protein ABI591_28255 [Kofleriaceae bacterium]